jgi:hypothetical protein
VPEQQGSDQGNQEHDQSPFPRHIEQAERTEQKGQNESQPERFPPPAFWFRHGFCRRISDPFIFSVQANTLLQAFAGPNKVSEAVLDGQNYYRDAVGTWNNPWQALFALRGRYSWGRRGWAYEPVRGCSGKETAEGATEVLREQNVDGPSAKSAKVRLRGRSAGLSEVGCSETNG